MGKKLQINATEARKHFFSLIDLVATKNMTITITKEGLSSSVQLKKLPNDYEIEVKHSKASTVNEMAGSLKSKIAYKKDEKEIAKQIFIQNYGHR